MYKSLKTLGLTGSKTEISLWLILKILKASLYFLYLVLLIYIGMIYTLICLNLTNIRLLMRFSATGLLLRILIITCILLFTGCIAALICSGSMCSWVYLIALTFGPNMSGRCEVVIIYMAFYGV